MKKAVIITGTSSGLGKALFDLLADRSSVYTFSLSRRFLEDQVELAQHKEHIRLIEQDLNRPDQLVGEEEFFKELSALGIKEIIFINNAGVVEPIGSLEEFHHSSMHNSINVNFVSPLFLTQILYKVSLRLKAKLNILNISSGAASHPIDGWALYCATKAGTKMFYDVLGKQHRDHQEVSVQTIDPGVMDTQMQEKARGADHVHFPSRGYFVGLKEKGQLPAPEEVARDIVEKYIR